VYSTDLPCERCLRIGQAVNCQFVSKLPSLVLPDFPPPPTVNAVNPVTTVNGTNQYGVTTMVSANVPGYPPQEPPSNPGQDTAAWKSQLESKINTFDTRLNDLVDIMKQQQQLIAEQQRFNQNLTHHHTYGHPQVHQQIPYPYPYYNSTQQAYHPQLPPPSAPPSVPPQTNGFPPLFSNRNNTSPPSSTLNSSSNSPDDTPLLPPLKKKKLSEKGEELFPKDFRTGYLTKEQASELFAFFNSNISQQLFGFEISKISVDSIWDSCPILVCAICAIASIHHPLLSSKSKQLQIYLHELCEKIIFKGRPKNEIDGYNTIVALILCSFWLSNSQMFTGLALQLAKEYGLNNPYSKNKDNLKLWYLLYILDGQQSLTFNRQPLLNASEYTFKHSREILCLMDNENKLGDKENTLHENKPKKLLKETEEEPAQSQELFTQSTSFTDLRLVSQVEYNQAINEAFRGNAWDLLMPSSFGIPSRSNLELDKWMVSWTVLLAPGNHGAVWSSKSTLIYYNFAKMSINSTAVRRLNVNPTEDDTMFPKWTDISDNKDSNYTPNQDSKAIQKIKEKTSKANDSSSEDEFSSEEEDEFISNSELIVQDETVVSANIAVNAASTVLNLVISDNDIVENLKYVPVHIHIMIYYAALLLLNPPIKSYDKSKHFDARDHYQKVLTNLRLIKSLQKKIYANLPIDTKFGDKLVRRLDDIVTEKLTTIKSELAEMEDSKLRNEILMTFDLFTQNENTAIEIIDSSGNSSRGSTPGPEKISAWPGSHHGHP